MPRANTGTTALPPESPDSRRVVIFADYTIYKAKGACTMRVIKPTWGKTSTGQGLSVTRDGTLLLEFANAKGEKEYDWETKESFGLSATECAEVLEMVEAGKEKSFFHDPNKMSQNEGQITKTLRLTPARDYGYYLNLTVKNQGNQSRFDVPVSTAELRVIRTVMEFMIPYMLGFNELVFGPPNIQEFSSQQFGEPDGPKPPF